MGEKFWLPNGRYVRLSDGAWHARNRERQPWNRWRPPYQHFIPQRKKQFASSRLLVDDWLVPILRIVIEDLTILMINCYYVPVNLRNLYLHLYRTLLRLLLTNKLTRLQSNTHLWIEEGHPMSCTFVGTNHKIRQAIENWNKCLIKDELLQRGWQWVLQPPKASHASLVWEKLIWSTRTALKAMLGERLVEEDVLVTVLTEVEATLNFKTLCAISDNTNDLQPLRPNHQLLQRTVSALPPGTFVKEVMLLRKQWRQMQVSADQFWRQW